MVFHWRVYDQETHTATGLPVVLSQVARVASAGITDEGDYKTVLSYILDISSAPTFSTLPLFSQSCANPAPLVLSS